MLGSALWFVVAFALLSAVLLDGAAAVGRATVHAAADHAVEAAARDAIADYQNALQVAIASSAAALSPTQPFAGTPPSLDRYASAIATVPNPLARTMPLDGENGLRFTVAYTVTPTTVAPPSCPQLDPGPASGGTDTIARLQCNAFVQESRMSLHVVVRVLDAAGAETLAQRDDDVTLRLFAEPPYSALAGRTDASALPAADAETAAPHEGDLAGDTISGASPQPSASPWPSGGTLIHVRYQCTDGAGRCANAAPPDPDADLRANVPWTNGNRPQP
jgi:hypothetical protein